MYSQSNPNKEFNSIELSNGNKVLPPRINRIQYIFDSTAIYDATFFIFYSSYNIFQEFGKFCDTDNSGNKFLAAIRDFVKNQNNKKFQENRLNILLEIGELHIDQIKFQENLTYYFNKLMGQKFSLTRETFCSNCNITKEMHYNYILPCAKLTSDTLKTKYFVRDLLFSNKLICSICNNILITEYASHHYIAVDLENQHININLNEIEDTLFFDNKAYILSGAIEVENSKAENKNYIAYCRTIQGFWVKKDCKVKKKKITKSSNSKLFVKLAFLIFIKSQDIQIS